MHDEFENKNELDLLIAESYTNTIWLIIMRWKKPDTINSLNFCFLSHFNHLLLVFDNVGDKNYGFYYNLDLIDTDSKNCSDLDITINISDSTYDLLKKIKKSALIRTQSELNMESEASLLLYGRVLCHVRKANPWWMTPSKMKIFFSLLIILQSSAFLSSPFIGLIALLQLKLLLLLFHLLSFFFLHTPLQQSIAYKLATMP